MQRQLQTVDAYSLPKCCVTIEEVHCLEANDSIRILKKLIMSGIYQIQGGYR